MVLNRNGVISIFDAVVFISILAVVTAMLFSFSSHSADNGPLAGEVTERFLSIELKASDVLDTDDTMIYPISILLSAEINSGHLTESQRILKETFDELIPRAHGYTVTAGYNGRTVKADRQWDCDVTSHCRTVVPIVNGGGLEIYVEIH